MTKALNEKAKASNKRPKISRNEALVDAETCLENVTQDLIATLTEFRKQVLFYSIFNFFVLSINRVMHLFLLAPTNRLENVFELNCCRDFVLYLNYAL
jgi:hypothetical protein